MTVVDRAGRQRGQDLDRSAAELRVERLESSAAVRPMEDALRDAARWLEDKRTIAARSTCSPIWRPKPGRQDALAEFAKRLDELPGANVYLIDVGVEKPRNLGLGALRLSSAAACAGRRAAN